jgi:HlyD family secretion protein
MAVTKKSKKIIYIFSAIIIILIAISFFTKGNDSEMEVTTGFSKVRNITEIVTANGKIRPEIEVKISSDVSGEIVELPVKEGDHVTKGQLLVRINPDLSESNLNRASAAVNNSKANLASADARLIQAEAQFKNSQAIFNRNEELFKKSAISTADFDNIKSNYESAKAEVEAAKQNVKASGFIVVSSQASQKEALDNYNRTTIYAPMEGIITQLNLELGERVVGTAQMAGTEIMTVSNMNEMEVEVDVNESDIVRVSINDTANIEADAYLNRKFKGIITEISNSAESAGAMSTDQVTNFKVKIRLLQKSYMDLLSKTDPYYSPFRPGMNASVEINVETKVNILTIPLEAVTMRTDTAASEKRAKRFVKTKTDDQEIEPMECVFVTYKNQVKLIPVKTGIQDDKYIEVNAGITKDSLEVVTGPYDLVSRKLQPGDAIKRIEKEDLDKKDPEED